MLNRAVNTYVAVRRAAGFQLQSAEYYLRDFTCFATARGDTHIVAQTAIAWAAQGASEAQRHNRLMTVIRFARFMRAENRRHELPPAHVFCGRRERPIPYIFQEDELQRLVAGARQLGPSGSLRPAVGHMKVHTFGKPYPHTLHIAFKANKTRAETPRSSKGSC